MWCDMHAKGKQGAMKLLGKKSSIVRGKLFRSGPSSGSWEQSRVPALVEGLTSNSFGPKYLPTPTPVFRAYPPPEGGREAGKAGWVGRRGTLVQLRSSMIAHGTSSMCKMRVVLVHRMRGGARWGLTGAKDLR